MKMAMLIQRCKHEVEAIKRFYNRNQLPGPMLYLNNNDHRIRTINELDQGQQVQSLSLDRLKLRVHWVGICCGIATEVLPVSEGINFSNPNESMLIAFEENDTEIEARDRHRDEQDRYHCAVTANHQMIITELSGPEQVPLPAPEDEQTPTDAVAAMEQRYQEVIGIEMKHIFSHI